MTGRGKLAANFFISDWETQMNMIEPSTTEDMRVMRVLHCLMANIIDALDNAETEKVPRSCACLPVRPS